MKNSHPLISLWINPRKTIQQLTISNSPVDDFRLIGFISLGYFIQIVMLIFMVKVIPASIFISPKGLQGMGWCFLTLALAFYTYANLTSLMVWNIAKRLNGKASIANTRTTLLWSMLSYLPVGFSFLLIYFAYSQKLMGKPIFLLDIISLITFPCLLIYSFILTIKMIAEINQFPLWRSFLAMLFCAMIQGGIIFTIFKVLLTTF
ncbi:MAG: hypothetical protein H0V82_13165 [Candidatus Protochlamydia sp.]|nr:hypothetical protein [Candidatus Protochlamydia sp.]